MILLIMIKQVILYIIIQLHTLLINSLHLIIFIRFSDLYDNFVRHIICLLPRKILLKTLLCDKYLLVNKAQMTLKIISSQIILLK